MGKARLFVAADIPDEIKGFISKRVSALHDELERARWVKPENLHLTLKFIGDYELEEIDRLSLEMHKAADKYPGFSVVLGDCGAFPSRKKGRVIWMGMEQGKEEAAGLANKLDARLARAGVKRERRSFKGHLTLARLKYPAECSKFLGLLEEEMGDLRKYSFPVKEVVLHKSILEPRGPVYIPLERVSLGRSG